MREPRLSVRELAAHLHVSPSTVYTMVADRRINTRRIGRLYRFDLEEVLEQLKPKPGTWQQSTRSLSRQRGPRGAWGRPDEGRG